MVGRDGWVRGWKPVDRLEAVVILDDRAEGELVRAVVPGRTMVGRWVDRL